jgi:hypothetical protein
MFCEWFESDSKIPVAVAVGIRAPRPNTIAGRVFSHIDLDSSPATTIDDHDFGSELKIWAVKCSAVELRLGSFDAESAWHVAISSLTERLEFILDLERDGSVLDRFRKNTRYTVRRAMRSGLRVRLGESREDLRIFAGLYQENLERLQRTKHVASLPHSGVESFAAGLGVLCDSGRGKLFLCEQDDQALAGCFFGVFNGSAYYLFGGSSEAGRQDGAMHLCLYTAIETLGENRITRVNLGGVPANASDPQSPDHGLYRFKMGFGPEAVGRRSHTIVTGRKRTRMLALARGVLGR